MAKGKSLLLGVLFGSLVGATTTLLTTPASGEAIRRKAKDGSVKLKDTIVELTENGLQIKNQLKKTTKEGAVLLKDLSQEIKQSIDTWKNNISPHQQNIHEHLKNVEESIKELENKMNIAKKG